MSSEAVQRDGVPRGGQGRGRVQRELCLLRSGEPKENQRCSVYHDFLDEPTLPARDREAVVWFTHNTQEQSRTYVAPWAGWSRSCISCDAYVHAHVHADARLSSFFSFAFSSPHSFVA